MILGSPMALNHHITRGDVSGKMDNPKVFVCLTRAEEKGARKIGAGFTA